MVRFHKAFTMLVQLSLQNMTYHFKLLWTPFGPQHSNEWIEVNFTYERLKMYCLYAAGVS